MKVAMAVVLGFLLLVTPAYAQSDLVRFFYPGKVVSILLPRNWKQNNKENGFAVISPNEQVSVNGSAYRKGKGLQDFANGRWEVIKDKFPFYKVIKGPYNIKIPQMNAVASEYEGIWPGDKIPTYYYVVCAQSGDKFISLAFTMTAIEYQKNRSSYFRMSESLRIEQQ